MARRKKYGFSFSLRRATGVSALKGKISRKTGIPLTKSGRERKVGRLATGGGCCVALLSLIVWGVLAGVGVAAVAKTVMMNQPAPSPQVLAGSNDGERIVSLR